jgi:ABC-type glycerol-3-phosphate transport system substrate-binding protein
MTGRLLQGTETNKNECCDTCALDEANESIQPIRILTWSHVHPTLQAYVDLYHKTFPQESHIQVVAVPSLADLNVEIQFDLGRNIESSSSSSSSSSSNIGGLYDGFVVPPILMGSMYGVRGLASWTSTELASSQKQAMMDDLLPYYRYQVATYDGAVRGLPLFAGSQMLLLFRKDYLDAKKLPTPKTWSDWIRIAAAIHNEPLADGKQIYGSCLGRLSEEGCRKRMDVDASSPKNACNSQSMSYLGMMLASMTQVRGNSTGWILDANETSPSSLDPLFQPTLELILVLMEQQIKYGAPDELIQDSSFNLKLFQEGRCALTITADHNKDLLNDDTVGFVILPGSHQYLVRTDEEMIDCTATSCPYGMDVELWGRVNYVPFGATDATVGTVSALVSQSRQEQAKKFFEFVLSNSDLDTSTLREQPLKYSELEKTNIPGYKAMVKSLTTNANAAIPFRAPNAFDLFSELDNKVYEYLVEGNYTDYNRRRLGQSVDKSWQMMMQMYDARGRGMPTAVVYQKSLDAFGSPEFSGEALYIGKIPRIIGWSLAGITCLCSIGLAIWVWHYRHNRVIRGELNRAVHQLVQALT